MAKTCLIVLALLAAAAALYSCALPVTNFSQYPGFEQQRALAARGAATVEEQALLQRFRPRFVLPPGHPGAIDFYADYIAHGALFDASGRLVSRNVDRALLDSHKRDPRATFVHAPGGTRSALPAVYARVDHDTLPEAGEGRRRLTFLTYHVVFRHSGLPAGFDGWRAQALSLIADLEDWHQLDHYTAASVVLDETQRPIALMLQQHNYTRSYVFGESVDLPADGRVRVSVALRSNELYPYRAERVRHRAVRFMSPAEMRYMMGFAAKPTMAEDDITEDGVEAEYRLEFLPLDDAFYTFQGFLGERRRLPGRDAPPGADFNIWPTLKPLHLQLLSGYWREGNAEDRARFEATYAQDEDPVAFARAQLAPFLQAVERGRAQ